MCRRRTNPRKRGSEGRLGSVASHRVWCRFDDTKSLGDYDTIAECHVAATKIFWERMPINQEAVCIRVEYQGDDGDD